MITVLLIVHLLVTLALIGVVLIQRSEGGGLGVGTSQGMGGFMSGRGTANLLTRTTAVLGTAFFVLSMALALLNRGTTVGNTRSILDAPPTRSETAAPIVPTTPALTPNPPASPVPNLPASPVPGPTANPVPAPAATVAPPVTPPDTVVPALPDAPPPPATTLPTTNGGPAPASR